MTDQWLNTPYRTIIEFCEMKVVRGYTVIESLKELKVAFKNSGRKNEVVEKGFVTAMKFVRADKAHTIRNSLIQGVIIESMKKELN